MNNRRSSKFVLALGAVAVFFAGMVLRAQIDSPSAEAPSSTSLDPGVGQPAVTSSPDGPSGSATSATAEVQRSEQTEDSSVAAALDLAVAPQAWMYLSDEDLEVRVRAVASTASADRLVTEIAGEVGVARDALAHSPGRIWWLVRPLAWRIDAFSPQRAQVSVWTVSVLSAADVAMPQSDWVTTTFDLAWEGAAWRLVATRDTPGPTPQLGGRDIAWEPEPFDDALAGFQRIGTEIPS